MASLTPVALAAQRAPERAPTVTQPPLAPPGARAPLTRGGSVTRTALMTAGYATGGIVAGLVVANRIPCGSTTFGQESSCDRWKDYTGAMLGGAALAAFGAHAGNRMGGRFGADAAVALGGAGASLLAARAADNPNVLIPLAGLNFIALVGTEHLTTRPRAPLPPRSVVRALPAWELRQEKHSRYASLYGLGGALLGGVTGMYAGGFVGYRIGYAHDVGSGNGCEDCGLGGAVLGVLVGGVTGAITGGLLGAAHGDRVDEAEAAQRILNRR